MTRCTREGTCDEHSECRPRAADGAGALAHGLPQVILPQGADNFRNAAMIERSGAGVAISPESVNPESVRAAVLELLERTNYVAAANALAVELAAMPSPQVVAGALRAIARG